MNDKAPKTHVVNLRVPESMAARMAQVSAHHGRGIPAELRAVWEAHDARSTLIWLDSPEAAKQLGKGLTAAQEQVQATLSEVEDWLYQRPAPLH